MEEKLKKLYNDCVNELKCINIDVLDDNIFGKIDISLSKKNVKRYGCCKQESPDKNSFHYIKRGRKKLKVFDKFNIHHIEISKWVMDLDDKIIKNTIMHEIIHCIPGCNNHGSEFKKYCNYINKNLGYEIKRTGNKKEDYKTSNVEYNENEDNYKYKFRCKKCGLIYLRKRIKKNFIRDYRCGKCKGKLELIEEKQEISNNKLTSYFTYMIRCEDNSIYTGITTNLERRMNEHFNKTNKCAKYTMQRTAKKLEAAWESENRKAASQLEFRIKQLEKAKKEELIKYNNLCSLLGNKVDVSNYKRI